MPPRVSPDAETLEEEAPRASPSLPPAHDAWIPNTGGPRPERIIIKGRRIVINLTWVPGARYLRYECINSAQLREDNPVGNGVGPNYVVPPEIRPIVGELGLIGVDIDWSRNSQDMVFLCGWHLARVNNNTRRPNTPVPDISWALASFLKKFNYIVIPSMDAKLFTHAWLQPDNIQHPGLCITSIFNDFFADTEEDPRKFLVFHVHSGMSLLPPGYANDEFIRFLGPAEAPVFPVRTVRNIVTPHLSYYAGGFQVIPRDHEAPLEIRWRRRLRIACDYTPPRD